ncbi:MAG: NfeD family protein [Gammaproteobacteria bacterium]|nr:NfeD family protein [Gammaproteobacteria bacterium]
MDSFSAGVDQLNFWHWWVLAVLLLIVELLAPAAFFIWLGAAAVVVGLMSWVIPGILWPIQLVLFALLSVASVYGGRKYLRLQRGPVADTVLNERANQYIGKTYVLQDAITNGTGRIKVADSFWRVEGPDLPVGARVKVLSVEGSSFIVVAAE